MRNSRALVLGAVVVAFLAGGGLLVFRGVGQGGARVSIALDISGARMTPSNPTARQGDQLRVTVSADRAEEIHLHGYDVSFNPAPGKPDTKTFRADRSGDFEIEIETTATPLGKLTVNP